MTTKPLAQAPELPNGCIDFNKLNDACKRGDEDAVAQAVIVPAHESEVAQAKQPDKAPAADTPTKPSGA